MFLCFIFFEGVHMTSWFSFLSQRCVPPKKGLEALGATFFLAPLIGGSWIGEWVVGEGLLWLFSLLELWCFGLVVCTPHIAQSLATEKQCYSMDVCIKLVKWHFFLLVPVQWLKTNVEIPFHNCLAHYWGNHSDCNAEMLRVMFSFSFIPTICKYQCQCLGFLICH